MAFLSAAMYIDCGHEVARPSPQCLTRLPALEQWEHIAAGPELTRSWFTCSLACDIVLTAFVFVFGWISVGSPLLTLVPCVAYAVLAGGVLTAVHLHGPVPHAAMLCPAQALLKIYSTIYPLSQSVKNVCSIPNACGGNLWLFSHPFLVSYFLTEPMKIHHPICVGEHPNCTMIHWWMCTTH